MAIRSMRWMLIRLGSWAVVVSSLGSMVSSSVAQNDSVKTIAAEKATATCSVDLTKSGMMADILSNAMMLGLEMPESEVMAFWMTQNPSLDQDRNC